MIRKKSYFGGGFAESISLVLTKPAVATPDIAGCKTPSPTEPGPTIAMSGALALANLRKIAKSRA
jgi:hypothetical protein